MIQSVKYMMANATLVCGTIMMLSITSLSLALLAQYGYGLKPCSLCVIQRWPFGITALLGFIGLFMTYNADWAKKVALLVFLCALLYFANAAIAFYHTGVEQHWWRSALEGCKVDFTAGSQADLLSLIESTEAVRCDVIPWSDPIFNLSMANWNILFSFMMGVFSTAGAIFIARKSNGYL